MDDTDFQIISRLVRDGRAAFSSIGADVGLSPHGTADRVRRLVKAGVITGFTVTLDLERAGRALDAYIDVRLLPSSDPEAFEALVRTLPAVREYAFVTGRLDFQVRVACVDPHDLDQTVRVIRKSGGVAQTETRLVMRSWTNGELPTG